MRVLPERIANVGRVALLVLLAGSLLAGCSSSSRKGSVQVMDTNQQGADSRQPVSSGHYVVQRGDTLFSIAFRFGWDWKALAASNGIPAPYVIRPGQVIRFDGRTGNAPVVARSTPAPVKQPAGAKPQPTSATPVSETRPVPSKPAAEDVPVTPVGGSTALSSAGWGWPSKGALIGRFSSNGSLNKGIDIAGDLGQPVLAASNGSVVYAGSGLRGYGELVIIKHSDTYVSAYGHNRRLLVQEGQQVKAGQIIAEMGSTGTDRVKLHFEIRRQGKPVDPLQYLPKR